MGGMGEVFRAQDTRLNRIVAIKVLPLIFVTRLIGVIRFQREARAIAALSHPTFAPSLTLERTTASIISCSNTSKAKLWQAPLPVALYRSIICCASRCRWLEPSMRRTAS